MRIILDECVDWRLTRDLSNHDVKTARQMGWAAIGNGELLNLASHEFDAFITVDRNLSFYNGGSKLILPAEHRLFFHCGLDPPREN